MFAAENPSKPDVFLRYEASFDRQFKSALRLLELHESKHRKSDNAGRTEIYQFSMLKIPINLRLPRIPYKGRIQEDA
jgi:hypothetical protein